MARSLVTPAVASVALVLLAASLAAARPLESVICYRSTMALIESIEGRHECAYDSSFGYKAVGVGYNLDDRSPEREREFFAVAADWDRVKSGKECLNHVQINTLLTADVTRVHSKAARKISSFNDWCCNIQASFAHIIFSLGTGDLGEELDKTIARASRGDWEKAVDALEDTKWCEKHKRDCGAVVTHLEKGCDNQADWILLDNLPRGLPL